MINRNEDWKPKDKTVLYKQEMIIKVGSAFKCFIHY